ncbi:MAG: carbamoyltransferase HypF [Balneolaceae bacterium]|nr:MAG: carbamoyltransferase HypF [Balneolaceae bacterium]
MPEQRQSREIRVRGLVQGVGFRPFVYRLALRHRLSGWVRNADDGVVIRVDGPRGQIERFLRDLRDHPPKAAHIYEISQQSREPEHDPEHPPDHPDRDPDHQPDHDTVYGPDHHPEENPDDRPAFRIVRSQSRSNRITQVSPDIAVCEECLEDMHAQPHRIAYPFINCTHCGPRFTIIRELPYDRPATTMAPFEMCDTCRSEYDSPVDRRFHAQPVACNTCGPQYTLLRTIRVDADSGRSGNSGHSGDSGVSGSSGGSGTTGGSGDSGGSGVSGIQAILDATVETLQQGGIIAIKGLGGFHLVCDAENDATVRRLRDAKLRDRKPFAVMVRDHASASRFVDVTPKETEALTSWRRPIVLLKQRQAHLAPDINPGCATVGVMLPYMPFHHMLFERLPDAVLVMTSGNLTDEPIVIGNDEAVRTFRGMADAIITYNRDIHNRADDPVVFVAREKTRIIRRSRGYVPEPVRLPYSAEGIFAAGAELSHCFAVGREHEAMLSQHIGDLKDPATFAFFEESVDRFCALFRVQPRLAACDLHPDYLSTRYAQELGLPLVQVQHHHAHIAACMAEFHLDEPVIGICWDGTGLGTDQNIWGGEFLHADLASFERFAHFDYLPLPGGDKAAKQTWRTGLSLLHHTFGPAYPDLDLPLVRDQQSRPEWTMVRQAIERQVNAPLSSAAGRLFDAVAAITGVCTQNSYHAEAPIRLEALADARTADAYPFSLEDDVNSNSGSTTAGHDGDSRPATVIHFHPMVRALVADLQKGVPLPVISARFHNTLVTLTETVAQKMRAHYGTRTVVLTGGVFQNRYLLEHCENRLEAGGFRVFSPLAIPANDAGIALGQMAVAARKAGF